MKRLLILTLVVLGPLCAFGACAPTEQADKVLLILPDGESEDLELMLTAEVGVITTSLERAGFDVLVAERRRQHLVAVARANLGSGTGAALTSALVYGCRGFLYR